MKNRLTVGLFFGGQSPEHEVSLLSAENVFNEMRRFYHVELFYFDKQNRPFIVNEHFFTKKVANLEVIFLRDGYFTTSDRPEVISHFDVVFPIIHGTFGEDGGIQGYLGFLNIPFVGCDVASSVLCFDKSLIKSLLGQLPIPIGKYLFCEKTNPLQFDDVVSRVRLPFVVKPARSGSSMGVKKVSSLKDFAAAVENAFIYDSKIIFEEFIRGRELSCAILGTGRLHVSDIGEDIPGGEFNTYEVKYFSETSKMIIPADVDSGFKELIKKYSQEIFLLAECEGLARLDFFLTDENKIFFNEINTIPGFTSHSLFPSLMIHSGLSYEKLFNLLITNALDKHQKAIKH